MGPKLRVCHGISILLLVFHFNDSYFDFIHALVRPKEFKYTVFTESLYCLIVNNSGLYIPAFAVGFWSKTQAPSRARMISRSGSCIGSNSNVVTKQKAVISVAGTSAVLTLHGVVHRLGADMLGEVNYEDPSNGQEAVAKLSGHRYVPMLCLKMAQQNKSIHMIKF